MASEAIEMPASFDAKITNFRFRLSSIRGQVSVPKVVFLASIRPTTVIRMNDFIWRQILAGPVENSTYLSITYYFYKQAYYLLILNKKGQKRTKCFFTSLCLFLFLLVNLLKIFGIFFVSKKASLLEANHS